MFFFFPLCSANPSTVFPSTVRQKRLFGSDGPARLTACSSPTSHLWYSEGSLFQIKTVKFLMASQWSQSSSALCFCVSLSKVSCLILYLCMLWLKYAWHWMTFWFWIKDGPSRLYWLYILFSSAKSKDLEMSPAFSSCRKPLWAAPAVTVFEDQNLL